MTYDNQCINGETETEKGMWPAQDHAASMVEYDLNSRQAEHPHCTIPGTPVSDVLWGCPPRTLGGVATAAFWTLHGLRHMLPFSSRSSTKYQKRSSSS